MKFYIYPIESFQHTVHNSEWATTPLLPQYIGNKPLLNNSFHPIGNFDRFTQASPEEADYFVVPLLIRHTHHLKEEFSLHKHLVINLPYFAKNPEKHIFFIGSDDTRQIKCIENSIVFSFSSNKSCKRIALHYQPNVNVPENITNINLCPYDVSFQGFICNNLRKQVAKIILDSHLKSAVINTRYWLEKFMENDTTEMERNYCGLMQMSKFILCPKGFGTSSIRFFESLAFGRIPILISDDTKLPLESKINYNDFIIHVPESEIESIPEIISDYKHNHELSVISRKCRDIHDKWFSNQNFHEFITQSILENNR